MRSTTSTKDLVRSKNQVIEGGTNFTVSHIKLEKAFHGGKYVTPVQSPLVYHT